jgi:hypothetical protein
MAEFGYNVSETHNPIEAQLLDMSNPNKC